MLVVIVCVVVCVVAVGEGSYVMFVSGLHFGSPNTPTMSMDMLVDFIAGRLGDETDQHLAQKIVR